MMQRENHLYQKDLYLPLEGVAKKTYGMFEDDWKVLDHEALGTIRLCLALLVAFNVSDQTTTMDVMKTLGSLCEKPSASNKVFLMKRLFTMKMSENGSVANQLSQFNTNISQLQSTGINFEEEVWTLLFICSLLDSWDGMVMVVSNFIECLKL